MPDGQRYLSETPEREGKPMAMEHRRVVHRPVLSTPADPGWKAVFVGDDGDAAEGDETKLPVVAWLVCEEVDLDATSRPDQPEPSVVSERVGCALVVSQGPDCIDRMERRANWHCEGLEPPM